MNATDLKEVRLRAMRGELPVADLLVQEAVERLERENERLSNVNECLRAEVERLSAAMRGRREKLEKKGRAT